MHFQYEGWIKIVRFGFAWILLSLFMALGSPTAEADADLDLPRVVVDSGGPYQSKSLAIQRFYDVIDIPNEYLMQPLSMVCTSGSITAPGYSWVRMILIPSTSDQDYRSFSEPIGRMLVNENSFLNSAQIYLDLSRQFKPGKNQVCIEAAGRVGAEFTWEIRSIGKPNLAMSDQCATVSGAWFDIYGSGFSLRPDENIVQLGSIRLPVGQSNSSTLQVFIPKQYPAGNYDLSVSIRNYKSRVIKLEIQNPKSR